VIKIRYRDPNELSPGLHAAAERHGRSTTVYLLSGLTAAQRRAALRRLRISARRGYDPKLPAPQLAVALLADRVRTTAGRAVAVFRSHPAGSTVPVMVISAGAIAFLALSIRVIHHPANPGPPPSAEAAGLPGAGARGSAGAGSRPGGPAGPNDAGVADPGQAGSAAGDPSQNGSGLSQGHPGNRTGNSKGTGAGNGTGTGNGSAPSSGTGSNLGTGTTLSGTSAPNPTPAGDPMTAAAPASSTASSSTASSSTGAAPAASAATSKPSAAPSASKSGLCVNVGPLGVCL
jgi:hypothetical protein